MLNLVGKVVGAVVFKLSIAAWDYKTGIVAQAVIAVFPGAKVVLDFTASTTSGWPRRVCSFRPARMISVFI
ncbi:MAG: hypothetical protein R3B47_00825 [Bacteroidia bacterium]